MRKFSLLLLILLLGTGCSISNKCEDYACFTPPPSFNFEIVDADTGENLFTNGNLNPENIQLLNADDETVTWTFISENNLDVISLGIGWEPGLNSYRLILSPELELAINIQSEQKNENCCTFYEINEFSISPFEYEQSPTTGFYKILIE